MKPLRFVGLVFFLPVALAFTLRAGDFSSRYDELRKTATPAQLYAFLYDLPKGGDLHNHFGGANIAEWIYAVCTNPRLNGGDTFYVRAHFTDQPDAIAPPQHFRTIRQFTYDHLPPAARSEYVPLAFISPGEKTEWCSGLRLDQPDEGRQQFFNVIWTRLGEIYHNPAVRFELLAQNMKAYAAEGLVYLETQFDVDGLVGNDGVPLTTDQGLALLHACLARPDVTATGLVVRFQCTVIRFAPKAEEILAEDYAFVDAHRDLWVGLNMAGIEENGKGYPSRFLNAFRELRSHYPALALSIHAGEMDGPDHNVRDTLLLGATRIGHGVNLIKDPDTLLLLQQSQRVLIEINLISNKLLEYVPDLTKHPFPEYLRTGIPVCLNTDDRGMWDSNMTDEYYTAVTTFNLSWDELVKLGHNSLAYSFVQPEVKARLLADYDKRVAAFAEKYSAGTVVDALARLAGVKPVTYGYAKHMWGFDFTRSKSLTP